MNKTNQVDADLQISLKVVVLLPPIQYEILMITQEYQKMQRKFEALQERNQTLTKAEELAKTVTPSIILSNLDTECLTSLISAMQRSKKSMPLLCKWKSISNHSFVKEMTYVYFYERPIIH